MRLWAEECGTGRGAFAALFAMMVSVPAAMAESRFSTKEAMKQVDATIMAGASTSPDYDAALRDIRDAERLINAALKTGDEQEVNRQSNLLIRLQSKLAQQTQPGDERGACWLAAGDLSVVASLMGKVARGYEPAKSLVAAEKIEASYRRNLEACEHALRPAKRKGR